jgi:stress-induced-phosphoprotein 1
LFICCSEAIKRNPLDARLYSNRAVCFIKLLEFQLALKDSEEGIRIDPTFGISVHSMNESAAKQFDFRVECYLRKGHALMGMKDFFHAMTSFNKILEIQPNNQVK